MRHSILAFLLITLSSLCSAGGLLVIGDSISAQEDSWPAYIDRHMMVMAQNNRKAVEFTLPADLRADRNISRPIYYLGTNDIPAMDGMGFYIAARGHLQFLKDRGFESLVVLPARYVANLQGSDLIRFCLVWAALELDLPIVDLEEVWDVNLTYDGVHPTPELSRAIAELIESRL